MKKIDFKIPPECSRISIKAEERRLILIFEPDTPNSFFCEETNRVEEKRAGPVENFMVYCPVHGCKRSVGIRMCMYFQKKDVRQNNNEGYG